MAFSGQQATVSAVCLHHGPYESVIRPGGGGYLDLSTLYRNVVKELTTQLSPDTLSVMVKGADWMSGTQLVNGALLAAGLTQGQIPARIFGPQIVTLTGAKLSKSLIRANQAEPLADEDAWMLDTRKWPGLSTVTHFPTIYMIGVTQFPTLMVTLPHGDGGCEWTPTGRALTRLSPLFI
ncbi:hypothetical protein ACFWWA_17315 [Streptomyces goshikiensis]|uniref:hypothetical protein n=1 Tax=Streptomyces goshikiensis TaxID=1942 RepID=UPI00365A133F